jgi:hypothetical protein
VSAALAFRPACTREEREEALAYIESFMRARFGCMPPPTVGLIMTARADGAIVGTMAVAGTAWLVPFPIEHQYEFDPARMPVPFDRSLFVQGSRWTASRPGVSHGVFRAAAFAAREFGKQSMLIEAKPYAVKRFAELGIACEPVPNAQLILEAAERHVGKDGMAFYLEPPTPTLFVLDLLQIIGSKPLPP